MTFPVSCATGLALADGALEVGPLPEGAVYDPVAREVTFSPGLDQAAVYEIELRVAQTGEVGRVKVGRRPWGIAASPDGRWIVTANGLADTISLIAAATLTVVRTIPVGKRPWGVTFLP